MASPFRLGFLTHVEGHGDLRAIYRNTLELFVAADQLGFDSGWVAQHHFKRVGGSLPSPFPFLAAAAERTRFLRLGTAVIVLPLEHPLRVAEDAAVVDALSGGRLELGVGTGLDHAAFAAFGVDTARRQELTQQGVATLRQAFRGEQLGGEVQQLQPPAPTLADRLWQGSMSVAGAEAVGRQGLGLMLARSAIGTDLPADEAQLPLIQAYLDAWGTRPEPLRIALSRGIYPAHDTQAAIEGLRGDLGRHAERLARQQGRTAVPSFEEVCRQLHLAYGHPEAIAATLAADRILPYATDLIFQFNPVIPSIDQAIWMLEQIATTIAPALGWQPQRHAASSPQFASELTA